MQVSRELYLDLMKKTLSFFLWPEPPQPVKKNDANVMERTAKSLILNDEK